MSILLSAEDTQLVLVDYQAKLMPVIHQADAVLANAKRLAKIAHLLKLPIIGTEQNPEKLGSNDQEIKGLCQKTLNKMHFGACEDGLVELLREPPKPMGNARSLPKHIQRKQNTQEERNTIVIAGCEAHVCLLQTALGLLEEEFDVWVVTDACGSRTELNRDAAFDRLAGNGAELVTTEMVIFELLRSCEHPDFKAGLSLVK
ncbi:Nicotinamidase-related amidase [Polynucleobacter victoriensis]|uniref:Nicotinamidase-related amidase n=1 Tax=Polynucleobacter victoriensis TaxID=2049319 RepID=A0A212U0E9_9BURK|nr:Nicotinamidase-related amidase [Polynucleobacter victoriensis]